MNTEEKHIPGIKKGDVRLYALSTCQWCRKTKDLLNELGVDYHYIDVDLVFGEEREKLLEKIRSFNPACSFPTMIIDERDVIFGFDEKRIREKFAQ